MAAKRRELEVVKMSEQGEVLCLGVRGSISRDRTNPQPDPLDAVVGEQGHGSKVLLGLMETDLIDSSGYSWLLNQNTAFRNKGGVLILHSVPPLVMQVLNMMRAELVFRIAPDAVAGMQMLQGDAV
jgi:anti-anti-sigma factor